MHCDTTLISTIGFTLFRTMVLSGFVFVGGE